MVSYSLIAINYFIYIKDIAEQINLDLFRKHKLEIRFRLVLQNQWLTTIYFGGADMFRGNSEQIIDSLRF